ncbi:septation protein SepH [Ornithinimicrobium cryptoxanthini]|uniref:Septation protein SepH n=1 Tax=Ornithinimicrobium cryptoxanthini TaxID=2934161 RepID=A0ABY4YM89_9MICO|nr:septation protein SepH [Ornithinimicrobium cryptoxanthini]USQ77625.1 septation protein SepH [Ornithinimicrobium cryptoxanthini]
MQQLRFTAVHEDGQHLVLSSSDGTEMLLTVDERLRAALRPRPAAVDAPATDLRPRHVQAMIRAGLSPAEVAEITGWPAERVARFEGPILAEREHVAGMARAAHVRGRGPDGTIPTLESRVRERLTARGVDADNTGWDATRPEGGTWTVLVTFVAGQRQRAAAWQFDPADRTVEALDDEARWLSEDEQALPGSAAGKELFGGAGAAEEVDLMTTMRERSRSRGRRKKSPTASADPAELPSLADAPEQVLPLEELAYDPDSMGLPPAARGESPGRAGARAARRRAARKDSARQDSPRQGSAGAGPDQEPGDQERAGQGSVEEQDAASAGTAAAEQTDASDAATTYDIELDFDDDYEVDPSPQEATLADLFGHEVAYDRASTPSEDDSEDDSAEDSEDDSDEEPEDELDGPEDEPDDASADAEPLHDASADAKSDDGESADEESVDEESVNSGAAASAADPADTRATDDGPAVDQEATKAPRRKDGRPGVPSWDDIMFGAKDRGH